MKIHGGIFAAKLVIIGGIKLKTRVADYIANFLKEKGVKDIFMLTGYGVLMTDNDYNDGILRTIAHKINEKTDKKIHVMGLEHRSAGHHNKVDNIPPDTSKIIKKVFKITK